MLQKPGGEQASERGDDIEEATLINKQTWNKFTPKLSHRNWPPQRCRSGQWSWCLRRLSDLKAVRPRTKDSLCPCGHDGLDPRGHVTVEKNLSTFPASPLEQEQARSWCIGCNTVLRTHSPILEINRQERFYFYLLNSKQNKTAIHLDVWVFSTAGTRESLRLQANLK